MGMDTEATEEEEVRSIHRLGMCSLVCDMLKLVGMGWPWGLHCICIERRWILSRKRQRRKDITDDLDDERGMGGTAMVSIDNSVIAICPHKRFIPLPLLCILTL